MLCVRSCKYRQEAQGPVDFVSDMGFSASLSLHDKFTSANANGTTIISNVTAADINARHLQSYREYTSRVATKSANRPTPLSPNASSSQSKSSYNSSNSSSSSRKRERDAGRCARSARSRAGHSDSRHHETDSSSSSSSSSSSKSSSHNHKAHKRVKTAHSPGRSSGSGSGSRSRGRDAQRTRTNHTRARAVIPNKASSSDPSTKPLSMADRIKLKLKQKTAGALQQTARRDEDLTDTGKLNAAVVKSFQRHQKESIFDKINLLSLLFYYLVDVSTLCLYIYLGAKYF